MEIFALPMNTVSRDAMRVISEREQRSDVSVGDQPNITAFAAVTSVRSAHGDGAFATKRNTPGAAVAGAHVQLALVDELAHDTSNLLPHPRRSLGLVTERATPHDSQHVDPDMAERAQRWAGTMSGTSADASVTVAHADSWAGTGEARIAPRQERENRAEAHLSRLATRSVGAGRRPVDEEPDPFRTCFERDRDRILHATSFRRLAGKTQVFVFPDDHQRTRLTHALEVAQVAVSVARPLGLNVALTEAIALGHDCGHGPGGHASEDALSPYVDGGFDHAVWGADVTLSPLNLCLETTDGIRNHSWSRPAPTTPEGEVVSWADRIAYVCHDFEDAVAAGIVGPEDLPSLVRTVCGDSRQRQLGAFITSMIRVAASTGRVGMEADVAEALAAFRRFNYEQVYLRPESRTQASQVIDLLRSLVDHYSKHPGLLPNPDDVGAGSIEAVRQAVAYVAGMTDRFACRQGVALLDYPLHRLPRGIDI
jgi:dGTPase